VIRKSLKGRQLKFPPVSRKILKEGSQTMIKEKVEMALNKVRPSLQADGGDVQLVDVDDQGVVKVKLTGACGGCPMSQMTLKMGIEKVLKKNVPEVTRVESV
jgi:Fe-S cluster biogenesis protein NfuA